MRTLFIFIYTSTPAHTHTDISINPHSYRTTIIIQMVAGVGCNLPSLKYYRWTTLYISTGRTPPSNVNGIPTTNQVIIFFKVKSDILYTKAYIYTNLWRAWFCTINFFVFLFFCFFALVFCFFVCYSIQHF